MTLATDYALGLLSAVLAFRMLGRGPEESRKHWAGALAASALAALAGGTYHGFLPWLAPPVATALWKATLLSIGCAAWGAGIATVRTHLPAAAQRALAIALGLMLAIYAALAMAVDAFLLAIIDYSLVFVFVLIVHARAWMRWRADGAILVVGGVLTSFLGAAIQALGISPHPHFNHNDLYHVVQMAGTWALYRGASLSRRRAPA